MQLCKHTSYVPNYNKERIEDSISLLDVFDEVSIRALANITDFGRYETLMTFLRRLKSAGVEIETVNMEGLPQITVAEAKSRWLTSNVTVLFITHFWTRIRLLPKEQELSLRHVRFTDEIRQVGRVATNGLFKSRFNAVHVRFDDNEKRKRIRTREDTYKKSMHSTNFLRAMWKARFRRVSTTIYVATVPSMIGDAFFDTFEEAGFNLVFSKSLRKLAVVQRFLRKFPKEMAPSLLGIVEQLVCRYVIYWSV